MLVEKSDNVLTELSDSLIKLRTLKEDYEFQYMKDVLADKSKEVPQDLKRGVLSEDAVHMLLADLFELSDKMEKLSKKIR
ncbi:hypothetical protein DIT68_04345 [Brumimicrobium oceani]|uniref:Uncharacterized protein n=1 Tax=Brumimicrobium oceani TaxID=2100725 RepID=A0A2U2XFA1_9FLAO|nr:hypothetical protein DIT68_04345 [Brumimicrobium oceani]